MSYDKSMSKNSFRGSIKEKQNVKPYDRNQSMLSRVKNAMKDYLTPSWMHAVLSSDQEGSITQKVISSNEPSGYIEEKSFKMNEITPALNKDIAVDSTLKRRLQRESSDDLYGKRLGLEPQRKRRAVEGNVEFVGGDISPLSSTAAVEGSRPLERSNSVFSLSFSSQNRPVLKKTLFSLNHSKTPENSLLMSPFYNGPVIYGGANAHRQTNKSFDGKECEDHQVLISKTHMNMGLSKTTQKILKVLEESKIQKSDKTGLPPLTISTEQQKSLNEILAKKRKLTNGPPLRELCTPSKVNVKPNYASVNNSKLGRSVKILGEKHDLKEIDEENNSYADLSHIKLPAIALVPLSQPPITLSCRVSKNSNNFKFSLPRLNQERRNLINVQNCKMIYTFSEPKCKISQHAQRTHEALSPEKSLSSFEVDFTIAKRKTWQDINGGVEPAKALKKGSDSFSKISSNLTKYEQIEVPLSDIFKQSSGNMWKCTTCLVSNKAELTTCPCCSTTIAKKTDKSSHDNYSTPSISAVSSELNKMSSLPNLNTLFAAQPGEWSCEVCMIKNKSGAIKCAACETAKPGSSTSKDFKMITSIPVVSSELNQMSSLPSLTTLFAAQPGEWSCEVCMIKNKSGIIKCAACETAKPGSSNKNSDDLKSSITFTNSTQDKWKLGTTLVDSSVNDATASPKTYVKPTESLSVLFAAKQGEWSCQVCLIRNKGEDTKCVACETIKPGVGVMDACKENSNNSETASSSSNVIIDSNKGGFSFLSCIPFNASEFGSKPGCDISTKPGLSTSGGFKPSFGLSNSAISSTNGTASLGGGFRFNSPVTCSTQTITPQFQNISSNQSSIPTISATVSNEPLNFNNFGQVAKTVSGDEDINNSDSLFGNSNIKSSNGFTFAASNHVNPSTSSNFKFESKISPFGFTNANSVHCLSASEPLFTRQENKAPILQIGLSSGGQNIALNGISNESSKITSDTFAASSSSFGQNLFSANKSTILPSSSNAQNSNAGTTNSNLIHFGQNACTATTTYSEVNTSSMPNFGQNVSILNGVSTFNFVSSSSGFFSSASGQSNNLFAPGTISTGFQSTLTGAFGQMKDSSGFNSLNTKSNCGEDTAMESPQPSQSIGFSNTTGFNFPNNNIRSLVNSSDDPVLKGFSFSTVPTFNFSQVTPNFSGVVQTVQQHSSTLQQPSISSNNAILFSSGSTPGGRIIKKAARRMVKK